MQQQQQPYYDTMSVPPPPSYMSTTHGGGSSSMPPPPPPLPPQAPDLSSRSSAGLAQHSRTSSASGGFGKSPAHPEGNGTPKGGPLAHKYSEDDMLNHSYHHLPAPNGGPDAASPDPRYHQLLSEYRRMCQINEQLMQQQHPQQQQQQQQGSIGSRSGSGSAWRGTGPPPPPPPPPQEFSGASNAGYWNPGTMSYPPYPTVAVGHSPQVGGSSTANGFPATPTANAIDNRMPSFGASAANHPASPLPQSPKAPVQAQSSPTTKGPSKLSAPPQSGLPVKKVSKKQQEAQAEAMTKEAYITHLERLIQQKDELLAKFEGKEPDVLDSAVQATVWTAVARTQTGGDDEDEDSDGFNKDDSPLDSKAMSTDGKCLLLETQNILVQCGFTTLRPLTLQLHADAATGGGGLGGGASHGNMGASYTGGIGIGSPQPRWAHRPYGLTKKRSSGQISVDSTGDAAPSSELLVPMPGNLRWADEPCDLDLAPPTPDRRGASITGAGTSTSSWRGDSQGGRGTWRGGSRATARQSAAQTL